MNNTTNGYKTLCYVGAAVYSLMALMALYWWETRIVYTDTAFVTFEIIRTQHLAIQASRYGSFVTQLFPWVATLLHAPLRWIVAAYSLSFVLFHFGVFAVCAFVLRNYRIALVLLFGDLIMTMDTFFWVQSELLQALAWMVLTYACLDSAARLKRNGWLLVAVAVPLAVLTVFTHPLAVLPMCFVGLFMLLERQRWPALVLLLTSVSTYCVKKRWFVNSYDAQAGLGLEHFQQLYPHYLTLDTNKQFYHNMLQHYQVVPFLLLALGVLYVVRHSWLKLLLLVLATAAYILLINVSYEGSGAPRYHLEAQYAPLAFMIAVPVAFDLLPVLFIRRLALPFLALVAAVFIVRVVDASHLYANRVRWLKEMLVKHGDEKIVFPSAAMQDGTMLQNWGTPYEWWLLSTIHTGKSASLIVHDNPDNLTTDMQRNDAFITRWGTFPYHELPKRYFHFSDSVSTYRFVEHP